MLWYCILSGCLISSLISDKLFSTLAMGTCSGRKNLLTHRANLGEQSLLDLAEESFALNGGNGLRVELSHGLPR